MGEIQYLVITNIVAVLLFTLKEIFTLFNSSTKKNTEETIKNTMAIAELKLYIKTLNGKLDRIEKLEKSIEDVDHRVDDITKAVISVYQSKNVMKQ